MAGYGSRDHPSEGVDTQLHVRCVALKSLSSDQPSFLISVDTIGLPGSMTRELALQINVRHGTTRENLVFCSTHTHAGPDLVSELSNIFATELTDNEVAAGKRYKQQLQTGILKAVDVALEDLAPAKLAYAVGQATFAANRRVLINGRWTAFGVQPDGPVDHTVPVLRITDTSGKVRGVVFNYACHCTTLGGDHYKINGDWAGYAATNLEAKYPGAVALCTIGCGADANPEPRGSLDATKIHGRTLAAEVGRIVGGDMNSIDVPLVSRFDYAALSFDLPTQEELEARAKESRPQTRRHAEQLLGVLKEHGRLPATYPVPIQSWQFGNQLTMLFLGGEVVVDYALRLKKTLDDPNLWVTAYANDVLGYIASERMRVEGGYEYDRSGIYYGLPGPWATGSEDLLVTRVEEMLTSRGRSQPIEADAAVSTFQLTDGFEIDLIAAEPLVQDPVNIAFDAQGRLWVVEMGDYPLGENGGRVKTLTDVDGDGKFDKAIEFLSDLPYPTGVLPWRDGVLISAAPDILFAQDTDDDGRADKVEKLYTGFRLANPQHRINGFSYGLDHSLHLASGDNLSKLTSVKTGETIDASGHDVQIWPDSNRIAVTNGRTQYVRSRNDWGQWFGNDNSRPMYHFPIDDAYLKRNPAVRYSGSTQQLFDPPVAPPVFPITSATERFNDLFAANRFTSACSAIVVRTPAFEVADEGDAALICEPVHNLVHRALLRPTGATYQAARSQQESASEFIASSDPWFRPVRAMIGPDGMLYVVDMYRETIEHPEWIPEAWQAQLDLRAGSDRGRIYRISPRGTNFPKSKPLAQLSTSELVEQLGSPIGARRDFAQQLIIERDDSRSIPPLNSLASADTNPHARVHALSILDVTQQLESKVLLSALEDSHPGVLLVAIRLAESRFDSEHAEEILSRLARTAEHGDPRVVMQTALALGQTDDPDAGKILAKIASSEPLDDWVARAVSSSAKSHAPIILAELLPTADNVKSGSLPMGLLTDLLLTAHAGGIDIASQFGEVFADQEADLSTQLRLAASFTAAMRSEKGSADGMIKLLRPLHGRAKALVRDADQNAQQRCEALRLIGIGLDSAKNEKALLLDLVSPSVPVIVQQQAVDRMAQFSDAQTCQSLISRWSSMSKSVRDHCVSHMLQRGPWTEALLVALESESIQAKDLTPAARQQLTHTGSRSMRVRAQRLTRTSGSQEKRALMGSYLTEMNQKPDAEKGAALFKQHCAVCHLANEQGQAVGASLDNLTDRSDQALLAAILDPNRAVDPKYQSYAIVTEDARVLVGAIEAEVGQSITLAHADGKRSTVGREEITEMKNTGISLMPEGLETVLPPAAMRDLMGYLQTKPTTNAR
jgi:putative membrane-bound dehydrogenase-like protein